MAKILNEIQIDQYLYQIYDDRPDFDFLEVNQTHSSTILLDGFKEVAADGMVSYKLEKPLAIKTADCLPIAIIGQKGVANIHAGWRGLALGILAHPLVETIIPKSIIIGPHISGSNYEVGEEFKQNFPNSSAFNMIKGSVHFDLEKEACAQIEKLYGKIEVISMNICTFANLNYNSFRRNKTQQRNYNILKRI